MPTPRQLATLALVVLMIFSAGCAGWGTDGPSDDSNETETDDPSTAPENTTTNETDSNETGATNTTANDSSLEGTNTSEGSSSDESSDNASNEDENEDGDGDGDPSTDTQDTAASSQSAEADAEAEGDSGSSDSGSNTDSSSTNSEEREQDQEQEQGPEPDTHTLTVNVTSPEGNAVEGADVSIVTYDGGESVAQATTNEDGQATFEVRDGDYEIIVGNTQFGQPSDDRLVTVDGEDTTREIQMVNQGGMYDYSMTVQVVDSEGNPISNELVQIGTPGEEMTNYVTDEDGEVTITFANSAEGDAVQQEIIVRGESHSASVTMGEQTEQITASGDRETHDLTVVAGEARDVPGTEVTIERWDGATTTKTTGDDGTVTFDVYPGEYTVTGVDPRGEEQSTTVTVPDQQKVLLDDMQEPISEQVPVHFTVVDQDGDPVEGVEVGGDTRLPNGAGVYIQTTTDENGEATDQLHDGERYTVEIRNQDQDDTNYQVESVQANDEEEPDSFTVNGETDVTVEVSVIEKSTVAMQTPLAA